jgi:hypothetical protein
LWCFIRDFVYNQCSIFCIVDDGCCLSAVNFIKSAFGIV